MTLIKQKIEAGKVKYVKYSKAKPGDILATGTFEGTSLVKAYDPSQPEVPQHTILTEDGLTLKLNSAGHLNYLLRDVQQGSLIEIVYLGKEKIKLKTGRTVDSNQFEVHRFVEEDDYNGN